MEFDLDQRTASFSVGEFSNFSVGPHSSGSNFQQGIWRAQLGTQWHNEIRQQVSQERADAEFEITINGQIVHHGWKITLSGRIDQILPAKDRVTLREIKTVTRALPVDDSELRRDYPEYFTQIATYLALRRIAEPAQKFNAELLFIEAGSGLAQTIPLNLSDEAIYRSQLERVTEFLNLRLQSRERLRNLSFRPAFVTPRLGQETTSADLTAAFEKNPAVLFEAPTGFGKTGVLLEFALQQLRSSHFDRALYLTSKSTGQIQVAHQLQQMTASTPSDSPHPLAAGALPITDLQPLVDDNSDRSSSAISNDLEQKCHQPGYTSEPAAANAGTAVAAWHVRNKSEHCVNHTFHCVRESCSYLKDMEERWATSGLSRFYRIENHARDLDTLRAAGRDAGICPYEITRTALAFNDVWIGDYNYVFAPRNRSLFYEQPGFDPARTLLILDEAHNLPSRVADALSHRVQASEVRALLAELDHLQAPTPLIRAWESYTQFLSALLPMDTLAHALEDDLIETLDTIVTQLSAQPLDYAALGPEFSDQLWLTQELLEWLRNHELRKLLWCPREGELALTCFDAASAIGETLRTYGGVVLASATLSPTAEFTENIGMQSGGADSKADRTMANESHQTRLEITGSTTMLSWVEANTPWRDDAYNIAVDARVDTSYKQRKRYLPTTARTVAALHESADGPVAIFFPSYAYADSVLKEIHADGGMLRIAMQPRVRDLQAQAKWVEESLLLADALFLVLGSSFAESIDLLGGRISHAMVVGPALPEVNAVQHARMAELNRQGREAAFRRVYQVPGLQKVNQALGRLVRAPGQHAKILLHCRRFADARYASLLAKDYQFGTNIESDADLQGWLEN